MLIPQVPPSKSFVARAAAERLLARVGAHVACQVVPLEEAGGAQVAGKRSLARVLARVLHHVGPLVRLVAAHLARERAPVPRCADRPRVAGLQLASPTAVNAPVKLPFVFRGD